MSLDYSVHVGPYVECKTYKKNTTASIHSCTKPDCENQGKEVWVKFCSICGTKIGKVDIPIKANKVDRGHLFKEMNDVMMPPSGDDMYTWMNKNDTDLWFGNHHRPNKKSRSFHFDPKYDSYFKEITPEMIAEELTEFQDQYRKEISILSKHYGLGNITIKWGVIATIS